MLDFWQSGWFWLFVGSLLLLLAGCVMLPRQNQTETDFPSTLHPAISFTVTPFSGEILQLNMLEPSLEYVFTPTTRIPRQTSSPPDDDYYAERPNCFPSPNGGYGCLGRVWNNSNQASGSILLSVNFLSEQGQILQESRISVEQRFIPAQSFAPYRLLIPPLEAEYEETETTIERVLSTRDYAKLSIIDSRGQMSSTGRYRLTATILNDVGERLVDWRLLASLVDDEQRIIGYRIYEVEESLEIGERRVLEMEIIPETYPVMIYHSLHAEGRIAGE